MAAWAVDPGGPAGAAPILFSFNSPAIANAELLKKQAQMMSAVPGYEQLNKDSKCIQYTGARSRTARNELRCQCAWLSARGDLTSEPIRRSILIPSLARHRGWMSKLV
jgi:hypothetical protein